NEKENEGRIKNHVADNIKIGAEIRCAPAPCYRAVKPIGKAVDDHEHQAEEIRVDANEKTSHKADAKSAERDQIGGDAVFVDFRRQFFNRRGDIGTNEGIEHG